MGAALWTKELSFQNGLKLMKALDIKFHHCIYNKLNALSQIGVRVHFSKEYYKATKINTAMSHPSRQSTVTILSYRCKRHFPWPTSKQQLLPMKNVSGCGIRASWWGRGDRKVKLTAALTVFVGLVPNHKCPSASLTYLSLKHPPKIYPVQKTVQSLLKIKYYLKQK